MIDRDKYFTQFHQERFKTLRFEYPIDKEFQITIKYTQDIDNDYYILTGRYNLKSLDYIRSSLINGSIKNDLDVFYRQLWSNFLRKYGKIREGYEKVYIDGELFSKKHKAEMVLESIKDSDYVDEIFKAPYIFYIDDWTYCCKALDI